MKYCIKKALKALGLYNVMCRTFLPKRKFIVEPFVYIDKRDGIARGEITDKVRWLEKFEIEAHCVEDAESEFWKDARVKYGFCDAIWLLMSSSGKIKAPFGTNISMAL